jgi:alpha-tubulin suppressor-like RCC1 family protein/subtilisin family serine protease
MITGSPCSDCGREILRGAPDGLCPNCLLSLGLNVVHTRANDSTATDLEPIPDRAPSRWARSPVSNVILEMGRAARCLFAALFVFVIAVRSLSAADDESLVSVYLVLEGEPTVNTALRNRALANRAVAQSVVKARENQILAQQNELIGHMATMNLRTSGRFSKLVNALRVHVPPSRLAELEILPGVVRVEMAPTYTIETSTSVPFIGAPAVWSGLVSTNATGEDIRIGIIDTGIDYLHADFGGSGVAQNYTNNNPAIIEPGTFPTAKVVGGYDFAGDAYVGNNAPVPDPDPLDCAQTGHGSHVAGIAAGFGVLTNGQTFSGAYTQGLDASQFIIGPGVAPRAKLYALKVFGCTGSTQLAIDALEWAADPNSDGDFSDRLDVVNLSLGAAFGFTGSGDVDQDAINQLADLGCIVVAGSGNNGNVMYNAFSPGVAEKCLSVGNSIDGGYHPAVQVLSPPAIAGLYEAVEGTFTRRLSQSGTIEGNVVYVDPPLACDPIGNVSGRIALVDRGICTFVDKLRQVQAAGAIAAIVVNNVPGPPITMGGTATDVTIPGVMIGQADGDLLKAQLNSNLTVRLGPGILFPQSLADQLDLTSSRGPASPSNILKPEIVAPGNNITSVLCGGGNRSRTNSGTSMATPHVAGSAALLRQLHPDWSVEDIKAALMNTAARTRDSLGVAYPESWTGAGRVQVDQAARAAVTVKAAGSGGLVSLSFGALTLTNVYSEVRQIELTNHGALPIEYSIVVSNTVSENGFSLWPLTNSVTVPAQGSARIAVQLTADPSLFDRTGDLTTPPLINNSTRNYLYEASGQIWFQNPNLSLHLPFYCNLRAGSSYHAPADVAFPTTNTLVDVAIPMAGSSAHPSPIVSAFQLGLISSNQNHSTPWRATGDLIAIGAASDAPSQTSFTNSRVYFGIATAENWTTPQSFVARFEVLIDVDQDGDDDYRVFNSSLGNVPNNLTTRNNANDVFMAVVQNVSSGTAFTNDFLNAFGADALDTAPFNNSVLVLPAPVGLIGLTPGNTQFRYRVRSFGPSERFAQLVETTPYVFFDAAAPAVDTTAQGIDKTPFHADGQPLAIRVDRNVAANPAVLLLHHFNPDRQRVDVAFVYFSPPDELSITPPAGFAASGLIGGPFHPVTQNYTLTNTGTNALTWTAGTTANWLGVSSSGGTLPAVGATAIVTAFVNATANILPTGIHSGLLWFTNLSSGVNFSRQFTLTVVEPHPIVAWGMNWFGQTDVPSGLTNVLTVVGGRQNSLALRSDGTVAGWGLAHYGVNNPPSDLTNVIAMACGTSKALALQANGMVTMWGDFPFVPPDLTNVVAIAAGWYHYLALKDDGTVFAWGQNDYGATDSPPGLSNVVAIAGGYKFSLALKSDGTVVAWGAGETNDPSSPTQYGQSIVPPGLSNVVAIAAGSYTSYALKANGTVIAWGDDSFSQRSVPPGLSNVVAIAAGEDAAIALKADGTVVGWGNGETAQLPADLRNVVAIAMGTYHGVALLGDGPPVLHVPLTNPEKFTNRFSVSLSTRSGKVYALEYKHSLADSQWTPLPLVAGNGRLRTLIDLTAGASQRFYRVRQW